MSVEIHVLIERNHLPGRSSWQSALDHLELPLLLDSDLAVADDSGFVPCHFRDRTTGFELNMGDAETLLQEYPALRSAAAASDCALSFRFAGDLAECASSLTAAAALVSEFGGIAYMPAEDLVYTLEDLLREIQNCSAALDSA